MYREHYPEDSSRIERMVHVLREWSIYRDDDPCMKMISLYIENGHYTVFCL